MNDRESPCSSVRSGMERAQGTLALRARSEPVWRRPLRYGVPGERALLQRYGQWRTHPDGRCWQPKVAPNEDGRITSLEVTVSVLRGGGDLRMASVISDRG